MSKIFLSATIIAITAAVQQTFDINGDQLDAVEFRLPNPEEIKTFNNDGNIDIFFMWSDEHNLFAVNSDDIIDIPKYYGCIYDSNNNAKCQLSESNKHVEFKITCDMFKDQETVKVKVISTIDDEIIGVTATYEIYGMNIIFIIYFIY